MPRENRKRGKKHKKQKVDEQVALTEPAPLQEEAAERAGPSWIIERAALGSGGDGSLDAPFGYVDPDVKAYFKTVDDRIREWQEAKGVPAEVDEGDADPHEEKRLFLVAALQELSGKEKQLATDPECSITLERMTYSMDDFVKRVFVDRLAGSFEKLARHRFGSHVVQTLLSVAKGTISREAKGIFPPSPEGQEDGEGRLPLLTELVINLSNELLPSTTSLLMDPFASHVLRALFVLLCPMLPSAADLSSVLRSKKSAKHRARQGPMKSVFTDRDDDLLLNGKGKGKQRSVEVYPPEFDEIARKFVKEVKNRLDANEVRAFAADKVACPVLVLLLEMESLQGASNERGSLMDSVSAGLISTTLQDAESRPEPSDYVTALLREPTSSHLLERLVTLAPEPAFHALWDLYFSGKMNRLAVHPVANFVVARAIERADADQLLSALEELKGVWPKIIKNARTGVLKAFVDRAASLKALEEDVMQMVLHAFGLHAPEEQLSLVECVLYLKPHSELKETLEADTKGTKDQETTPVKTSASAPEATVQGSVLLQSLLQLDAPHNQPVIQSLIKLPVPRLIALAHNPSSSRIIDALLAAPTVPSSARRHLILAFQDHFDALVDDRVGSRVGERLWAAADPYLKEKIARGLVPHERELVGSRYGKFFARGLNLYLLKRNPEEWKAQQAKSAVSLSAGAAGRTPAQEAVKPKSKPKTEQEQERERKHEEKKRKRKGAGEEAAQDEIEALFASTLGKRQKKGSLVIAGSEQTGLKDKDLPSDQGLKSVLGAIREAPKDLKTSKKKKRYPVRLYHLAMAALAVDSTRINTDLFESCRWGSTPDGGMNRLTLNDDDKSVREWFIDQVKKYGCTVKVDEVGNIFATRPGKNASLAPIGLGSHLDTQPAGGKYDGIVGVHSALEVLKTLHENGVETYAPIAVIDWTNEEGARFAPAMLGSGVWAGAFGTEYAYGRTDLNGKNFGEELERIGFKGDVPASHESNKLSAHFEVHIEQGPVLEAENKPIGVVTGVQAMTWLNVELRGREQHCGTTPMDARADTLLTAAHMIVRINAIALSTPGGLASVAVINSRPQSINTLASDVQFNIDVRARDDDVLGKLEERIERECREVARERGVRVRMWERIARTERTEFDERMVWCVREAAKEGGYGYREIQSGAGHDSVYTSRRVPTSMIFIRCKDGISHNPTEYASPEDITAGANVLLRAVLKYDAYLSSQAA